MDSRCARWSVCTPVSFHSSTIDIRGVGDADEIEGNHGYY